MNNKIFKPITKSKCKFPKCNHEGTKKSCLRKGLCNKHRKWAEKGIIDRDTCEILKPEKLPKPKEWTHCRISGCLRKHKAKGFCSNHYRSFSIYKTIDAKGNHIGKRRKYDKFSKCIVINCFEKKPLIKGMCKFHWGQVQRRIINQDGFKIRELKRVDKYPENSKCKIPKCKNKPRANWFCISCHEKIKKGTMAQDGTYLVKPKFKNINKKCSKKLCNEKAHCRGLCKLHYSRDQYGFIGPERFINSGKICKIENCENPCECRGLCTKHYRELLKNEKTNVLINDNPNINIKIFNNAAILT